MTELKFEEKNSCFKWIIFIENLLKKSFFSGELTLLQFCVSRLTNFCHCCYVGPVNGMRLLKNNVILAMEQIWNEVKRIWPHSRIGKRLPELLSALWRNAIKILVEKETFLVISNEMYWKTAMYIICVIRCGWYTCTYCAQQILKCIENGKICFIVGKTWLWLQAKDEFYVTC